MRFIASLPTPGFEMELSMDNMGIRNIFKPGGAMGGAVGACDRDGFPCAGEPWMWPRAGSVAGTGAGFDLLTMWDRMHL